MCVAKPRSPLGRRPASHGPTNFPISPPGLVDTQGQSGPAVLSPSQHRQEPGQLKPA